MTKKQFLKALTISSAILASVAFSAQVLADDAVEAPATTAVDASTSTLATTATPSDAKVETKVIEKATTEYVADPSLEHGTTQVVQEAKDTTETTTTTYTSVQVPQGAITDDTYRFNEGTAYTIDNSKEIPSDRIVIDETQLFKPLPTDLEAYKQKVEEIKQNPTPREAVKRLSEGLPTEYHDFNSSVNVNEVYDLLSLNKNYDYFASLYGEIVYFSQSLNRYIGDVNLGLSKDIRRYYANQYISDALYADAKATLKRMEITLEYLKNSVASDDERLKELMEEGKFLDEFAGIDSFEKLQNKSLESADGVIKGQDLRYVYGTFKDNFKIAEAMYVEAKEAFENLTRKYNLTRGYDKIIFDYTDAPSFNDEKKQWLEKLINTLSPNVRKNILRVVITDNELPKTAQIEAVNTETAGIAYGKTKTFYMTTKFLNDKFETNLPKGFTTDDGKVWPTKFEVVSNRSNFRHTFLHELSHIIDYNSGLLYGPVVGDGGFSSTAEFLDIYDNYLTTLKNSIDASPGSYYIDDYEKNTISEAFATGLAYYIDNVEFGTPYDRVIVLDGYEGPLVVVKDTDEEIGKIFFDKYYNDPRAKKIAFEEPKVKAYFEKVYNAIVSQKSETQKVGESVVTVSKGQNGKVLVGTKPTVTETEMPFATKEVASADLYEGERKVVMSGQTGLKRMTVTYSLKDKSSAELVANASEEVVRQVIDQVVAVGTAVKPIWQVPSDYPTVELPEIPIEMEVPKDYPTVELPAITIETEVPNDYPTVELPEIPIEMQVPADYPTVELPAITIETEVPADFPTVDEKPALSLDALKPAVASTEVVGSKVQTPAPASTKVQVAPVVLADETEAPVQTYSRVERNNQLPETGDKGSALAVLGLGIVSTLGMVGLRKNKKEI